MNNLKPISKFLSYVLRHSPESIGITMDANGWVDVKELLEKANRPPHTKITIDVLKEVVATNDKKRFQLSEDESRIRASQGHSVDIDIALEPSIPPAVLYHGTVARFIPSIQQNGLQKMNRQHVHLSRDRATANAVAARRGKPVILTIDTIKMLEDGLLFYLSHNGVWLCNEVPSQYINFEP